MFGKEREHTELEVLFSNPPQLILVFDNYRGPKLKGVADKTMEVRVVVASIIYNSRLYQDDSQRPIICCFAREHTPVDIPGSQKVARLLKKFGIPDHKIFTRKNTITTTTDLDQLHAAMISTRIKSAVIVTTDDHVKRTKLEIENHFGRGRKHGKKPLIHVMSPSSAVLDKIWLPDRFDDQQRAQIAELSSLGMTKELDGGFTEKIATAVAFIPIRNIRLIIQKRAERTSHPHTPNDLARIQRAAKRFLPE